MSSAKRVVISLVSVPGISKPFRSLLVRRRFARGLMATLKRRRDRGSPWRTPLETWKGLLIAPLMMTTVSADSYRERMVLMKVQGKLYFSIVRQR